MPPIQDLVYRLEVGGGVRVVRWIAAFLVFLGLAYWFDAREYQNFYSPEAMQTAEIARNLARGRGFTTRCIRPFGMTLVERKLGIDPAVGRKPHPELTDPPVYPLVLAGLMKIIPFSYQTNLSTWRFPPEIGIAIFNQVLFFLVLYLTYRLAKKLFDFEVAVLAVAMMAVSDVLWRFTTSGLSTILAMLWVVCLAHTLVRIEEELRLNGPRRGWFFVRGLLLGLWLALAGLTRYSLFLLIVPVGLYGFLYLRRVRLWVFAGGILPLILLVTPWIVRNYQVSGTPFGLAGYAIYQETLPFSGANLERMIEPPLEEVGFLDLLRKGIVSAERMVVQDFPLLGGHWLGGLFLAALILRFRNPSVSRLRLWILVALGMLTLGQAFGRTWISDRVPMINTENLLILIAPLILCYGAALLVLLLDQMDLPIPELRHFLKGVFIFVAFFPLLVRFLPPRTVPIVYPPYFPPWIETHASLLKPDELMMSDIPWAVAWYGDRDCIWIPMKVVPDFYKINDQRRPVVALYLTQETGNARFQREILQGRDFDWARFMLDVLLHQRLPSQFPLKYARQRYLPDQLLLCDRPRWLERQLFQPAQIKPPTRATEEMPAPKPKLIQPPPPPPQEESTTEPR